MRVELNLRFVPAVLQTISSAHKKYVFKDAPLIVWNAQMLPLAPNVPQDSLSSRILTSVHLVKSVSDASQHAESVLEANLQPVWNVGMVFIQ